MSPPFYQELEVGDQSWALDYDDRERQMSFGYSYSSYTGVSVYVPHRFSYGNRPLDMLIELGLYNTTQLHTVNPYITGLIMHGL